jgi:hypothetical protein
MLRHVAQHFALGLLRADPAADGGQRVGRAQNGGRLLHVTGGNRMHELRNRDPHRATVDTDRILAAQASFGFEDGVRQAIAFVDFLEITGANFRLAMGHRCFISAFDGHQAAPP